MIEFEHVTFTYPGMTSPALRDATLQIGEGTLALVVGPSGSGKSTLLRCINGLVPHFSGGAMRGKVRVNGLDPVRETPQAMSRHVGFVFQDPEAQFVLDQVEAELAFALENAAIPRAEMRARVGDALDILGLRSLRERRVETLSGGERQKVAIAAALTLQPEILVLDEPTSQLDPESADDVLQALWELDHSLHLTIVLAEHRLERILPYTDTLILVPAEGRPIAGPPQEVLSHMPTVPPLVALARGLGWSPAPLTLEEARSRAADALRGAPVAAGKQKAIEPPSGEPRLRARGLGISYRTGVALADADLELWPGEIVALMGRNGAGKTSLLKGLVGLAKRDSGKVWLSGEDVTGRDTADICARIGYLPQDPNALLFADSVREELEITLRNHARRDHGLSPETGADAARLLETLGLADKGNSYPRDLSVGERQRVALGAIAVTRPEVLLLDEPTRGLDYAAKERLASLLRTWRGQGMSILIVTHDVELVASLADRVILMRAGHIVAQGSPPGVLADSAFAPQMLQLFPGRGWLTPEMALRELG